MFLFSHHTRSHQGCSVASTEMWRVCLLYLSHSLQNVWRGSGKMVCFTYFDPLSKFFFHFRAVFWLYGNRVITLLSEPLDRLLCE